MTPGPVLVELVRSGVVESVHTGQLVVLGPTGEIVLERGRPDVPVFWRSAAKPLQAAAMLAAGLELTTPQLAMAAASHAGEPEHVRVATGTLADGGLTEADLLCPPAWPMPDDAFAAAYTTDPGPRRIYMNCSGKHAAMLRTCQVNDWPLTDYLDDGHPLQQHVRRFLEATAGEPVAATATDGCGLPVFALSLRSLARCFRELRAGAVASAMREHPLLVAGTGRLTTRLLAGVPGVLAKNGAEGVYAAALPDGSAVACKIDDGADRAAEVLVVAALRLAGAVGTLPDAVPVLGGGRPVGALQVAAGALPGV